MYHLLNKQHKLNEVFFVTVKYCIEVMRGKLLKFQLIGGTIVMYVIVINCECCRNLFGSQNAHVFAISRYCRY